MTNRAKAKGTAAETAVVNYLRARAWPHAERRALAGNSDKGDVAGLPGVVLQTKSCQRLEFGAWLREVRTQQANAGAEYGVVWAKRKGTTDPGEWYVVMDGDTFTRLLKDAGR